MPKKYIFFGFSVLFFGFSFMWPLLPEIDYRLYAARQAVFPDFISQSGSRVAGDVDFIEGNRLVIPAINVNALIVEGESEKALDKGVWLRPRTALPNAPNGNTVLTGHRFLYTGFNTNTFYNLDKVKTGDKIYVYWEGIKYSYVVAETFIVEPTEVEIEGDFGDRRLTLYTCHPLWTASKRLVVHAKPV